MWWQIHSISGALAVALGAFGAHGLKAKVKDAKLLEVWDTAVKYHLVLYNFAYHVFMVQ